MHRVRPLALAGCALAIAACGSSGSSSGSGGVPGGLRFANCMRSNGVPNFPDPGPGGGVQLNPGSIDPRSPAFLSAQRKCSPFAPGPGSLHSHSSEQMKLRMLALARCMRAHGLPSFPDPTTSAPAPGRGFGLAIGGGGSVLAVPQLMLRSPAFERAATACGFPGVGHGGGKENFAPG